MQQFRADLHCHSTYSDGSFTPEQLLQEAKNIGLKGLSITDHDTIRAYETAIPLAVKMGIELISGAEFSAMHQGTSVHILAYAFPVSTPVLQEFCQKHNRRRTERNRGILERLASKGMPITEQEIASSDHTVGRPHIAKAMLDKGYVQSYEEAFLKYLGDKKSCFVQGHFFSVEETLDVIHQAKGLAILAHPHLMQDQKTIKSLLGMKFDGIECHYSKMGPEQNNKWTEIASTKGWLMTGGSDFHGNVKPNSQLGSSWVDEPTFRLLQNHYLANSK